MLLITEFINHPLVLGLILGPLMSVILAALFAGLTNSPTVQAPETVKQTQIIYSTRVIERRVASKNSNDETSLIIALVLAILFIIWKYAIYFDDIQLYLNTSLFTILSFSITTIVISVFKGHYTSKDWYFYTLGPLLSLIASIFILYQAKVNFDPTIVQAAKNNSFFSFYMDWLSEYGRYFMITHVFGIVLITTNIFLTALFLIYYLSLMNQRSYGKMQKFWLLLTKYTEFTSKSSCLVFMIILIILAYFFIKPEYVATLLYNINSTKS